MPPPSPAAPWRGGDGRGRHRTSGGTESLQRSRSVNGLGRRRPQWRRRRVGRGGPTARGDSTVERGQVGHRRRRQRARRRGRTASRLDGGQGAPLLRRHDERAAGDRDQRDHEQPGLQARAARGGGRRRGPGQRRRFQRRRLQGGGGHRLLAAAGRAAPRAAPPPRRARWRSGRPGPWPGPRRSTGRSAAGMRAASGPSSGGGSCRCFRIVAIGVSPRNGTLAGEHLEDHDAQRVDVAAEVDLLPRACSGLMYSGVPTIVAGRGAPCRRPRRLAMPKSMSRTTPVARRA